MLLFEYIVTAVSCIGIGVLLGIRVEARKHKPLPKQVLRTRTTAIPTYTLQHLPSPKDKILVK